MTDATQDAPFEERVSRLETIVRELEMGTVSLEEALRLFEEGIKLARALKSQLDYAETRIEKILEDGRLIPLATETDDDG